MPVDELSVDGIIKLLETAMANKMTELLSRKLDFRRETALWAISATVAEDIKITEERATATLESLLTDELKQDKNLKEKTFEFLGTTLSENSGILEQFLKEELPELIRSIAQKQRPLRVGIMGGTKVGKTTLINYIADKPVAKVGAGGQSTTAQDEIIDIDIPVGGQAVPSRATLIDTMGFGDTRITEETQVVAGASSEMIDKCKRFDVAAIVLGAENGNNIDVRTCEAVRKHAGKVIFFRNKIDADPKLKIIENPENWEKQFSEFKKEQEQQYRGMYKIGADEDLEVYYTYCVCEDYQKGQVEKYEKAKAVHMEYKKRNNYGDDDIIAIRRRLCQLEREMQEKVIREGLQGIVERMLTILAPYVYKYIHEHLISQVNNRFRAQHQPGCPEESCINTIIKRSLLQDSGREHLRRMIDAVPKEKDQSEMVTKIRNDILLDMVTCIQDILFNQFCSYRDNKGAYPVANFVTMGLFIHVIYSLTADSIPKQICITAQRGYNEFGNAVWHTQLLPKAMRKKLYNKYWKGDPGVIVLPNGISDEDVLTYAVIKGMAENAVQIKARIEELLGRSVDVESIAAISFYAQMYIDSMERFIQANSDANVMNNVSKDLIFLSEQLSKLIPYADGPDKLRQADSRELFKRTLNYFRGGRYTRDAISTLFKKIPLLHSIIDYFVLEDGEGRDIRDFINLSNTRFKEYRSWQVDAASKNQDQLSSAMIDIIHTNPYDRLHSLREASTTTDTFIARFYEKVKEFLNSQDEEVRMYINKLLDDYIEDLTFNERENVFNRYRTEVAERFEIRVSSEIPCMRFSVKKNREEKGMLEGGILKKIVVESDVLMLTVNQSLYDSIRLTAIQNMSNNIPIQPSPAGSTFNSARGQAEEVISLPHFSGPIIPQVHEDAFRKLIVTHNCSEQSLKGIGITDREKVNMICCSGKSLLHIATELDSKEVVSVLISMGHDMSQKDDLGMTIIHTAAQVGACSIIRLLYEKGANANEICNGITPLMSAANQKQHLAVGVLIELGARVNDINEQGMTALHMAAEQNDEATVRAILRGKPDVNMTTLPYGSKDSLKLVTPIMIAITREDGANVVSALLESGADISTIKNQQNETAFIMALKKGSVPVIKAIFDGNIPISSHMYSLDEAVTKGVVKKRLCDRKDLDKHLRELMRCLDGHIKRSKQIAGSIAKMFLDLKNIMLGADRLSPNTQQYNEFVRRDIDHLVGSINVNLRKKQLYPGLIINELITHKDGRGDKGRIPTLLHLACRTKNSEFVIRVLDMIYVCYDREEFAKILKTQDKYNNTSLMLSICIGSEEMAQVDFGLEVVQKMLQLGARPDNSCLFLAEEKHGPTSKIACLLRDALCDIGQKENPIRMTTSLDVPV